MSNETKDVAEETKPSETPSEPEALPPASAVGPGRGPARRLKPRTKWTLGGVGLLVFLGLIGLYRNLTAWESTDDAQIDGYVYPVSSRVSGYVTRVMVDDHQYVEAGTVLVQLDAKDYEVGLANAKAALANSQANAAAQKTGVPLTSVNTSSQLSDAEAAVANAEAGLSAARLQSEAAQATLEQAAANDLKAQDDVNRYKPLAAKDEIPQQRYTQAVASEKATAAAVTAARASAAAAQEGVTQAKARLAQAQAQLSYARTGPQQISVQRARAEAAEADAQRASAVLEKARLDLQYTTVVAPVAGVVGQRSVEPGQNIAPSQQLMTIVPLDSPNIWVTANFKETQLRHMKPGQPVRIYVDTYGRDYEGRVLSIAGASGARYSLLPPENATGNYVKVVQRIAVKIAFDKGQDPQHLLRPGMSVEPDVRVK